MLHLWKMVLVIFVSYAISGFAYANQRIAPSSPFAVLVWNVHKETDSTMLANLRVFAEGADLVLLQEAYFSTDYYANLEALDIPYWYEAISFRMPSLEGWVGTGVATGAKWPSLNSHAIETETVEYFLGTTKQSLISHFQIDGQKNTLLVVNTHAINFVTTMEFDHEMRRLAQIIEEHQGAVLWAGDFNTWNATRLEHLTSAAADLGLRSVSFAEGCRKTFNGHPLDHVFYRGMQVQSIKPFDRVSSSDHLPLKVTFSLK